jgi:hypothetical protein
LPFAGSSQMQQEWGLDQCSSTNRHADGYPD